MINLLTNYLQKFCVTDLWVADAKGFLLPYLSQQKSFLKVTKENSCRLNIIFSKIKKIEDNDFIFLRADINGIKGFHCDSYNMHVMY
jgi:hypothetical protein